MSRMEAVVIQAPEKVKKILLSYLRGAVSKADVLWNVQVIYDKGKIPLSDLQYVNRAFEEVL